MRMLLSIISLAIICSCNWKKHKIENDLVYKEDSCTYTLANLFHHFDSTRFEIERANGYAEIMDSSKERSGDYTFDNNGTLRCYQYVKNRYSSNFRVNYDTSGNEIDTLKSPVVEWFVFKEGKDNLVIGFFLYHIHYTYSDIRITYLNITKKTGLGNPTYLSTLTGCNDTIANPHKRFKLYLTAKMHNNCTKEIREFTDSSGFHSP